MIFCPISRSHPRLSGPGAANISARVVPVTDNFFATLNSAVFSDGTFVYVPKGVRCPMELSTYFRINASETGQFERTLIIADEGAYVSAIWKAAPRPSATRTSCMRRWSSWWRWTDAEIKYSTVQNWYPGDEEGKGGIYNFVTKRGDCRGRPLEDLLDAGGNRLGHHLEISQLHPARRRLRRRILFHRHHQQFPAGRHRHQDDPSGQEHALAHHLQGHFSAGQAQNTYRGLVSVHAQGGKRAQLHAMRLAADRRQMRRAYRALYRKPQSDAPASNTKRPPRRSPTTSCSIACSAAFRRKRRWR